MAQHVVVGHRASADSTRDWVEREFSTIALGDERLNRRFKAITVQLAKHCGKTLASTFTQWRSIKAGYRFFANAKVCITKLLAPHVEQTVNRIAEHDTVLLLQDTTYLDYDKRPKTTGLDLTFGTKGSNVCEGLMLHNALAVTGDGVPLGLLDQYFIDRKALKCENHEAKRRSRPWNQPIEQKESVRWINVVKKTRQFAFGGTQIVHVADRECDLYEFYRDATALGENFVIRAARDRSINKRHRREPPTRWLFSHLKKKKARAKLTITIQVNATNKFRRAELSLIYTPITMPPPPNKTVKKDGPNLPMVPLFAVMAIERHPPAGHTAILWVVLTNMVVENTEQAIEKIRWYSQRWNIEVFHKVLKSGCAVEAAQLRDAERLKRLIVVKSIVAWRLFWLGRAHKHNPHGCCSTVLSELEWTVLYKKANKTKHPSNHPPTIGEVTVWIAKLGGYIGRSTDPPPGVITLWRGWQRLMDMVEDFNDIYG